MSEPGLNNEIFSTLGYLILSSSLFLHMKNLIKLGGELKIMFRIIDYIYKFIQKCLE